MEGNVCEECFKLAHIPQIELSRENVFAAFSLPSSELYGILHSYRTIIYSKKLPKIVDQEQLCSWEYNK